MDNNLYQLYYELETIQKVLRKVEDKLIWWLEEEEITALKQRKYLLEILVENA